MSTSVLTPPTAPTVQLPTLGTRKKMPLVVISGIAVVMVILYTWLARWRGITLSIEPQHVLDSMSPLLLASAFIERAVEVIISPWRDADAAKLEDHLDRLKAPGSGASAADIRIADEEFQEYKGRTQQYAFGASITLSMAAAYVGVRALWPFVNQANFKTLDANQQWMFLVVDVILSGTLLAGGADGIHSAVNAFTTFFGATAQKTQQAANAQKP